MRDDKFLRMFNLWTSGRGVEPPLILTSRRVWEWFRPYKGRRGPVTFIGTPREVIEKMQRYQKGVSR